MKQPESIAKLINKFMRLGGVGLKTAQRYAYRIVEMPDAEAAEFAEAIYDVKKNVRYCSECGNFSESDVCEICSTRDRTVVDVVAQPKDVHAIDKSDAFNGG